MFCQFLKYQLSANQTLFQPRQSGYFQGERIQREIYSLAGEALGMEEFEIEASPGSGFAGQVYRAVPLNEILFPDSRGAPPRVAIKVLKPRHVWKTAFRDLLFRLSYQTSYAPRLRLADLRSGLALQKILHDAAGEAFGDPASVACAYGYYWDEEIGSFAEIHEWVEGRPVRYEADEELLARFFHPSLPPPDSEIERKRAFMAALARLCHEIGAQGLARQYEWYTFVSQPNVLTRLQPATGAEATAQAEATARAEITAQAEFTAVDCRVGLAVPFFLPLSPVHARIILSGLRGGIFVHFAEVDLNRLQEYLAAHPQMAGPLLPLAAQLAEDDAQASRGLPDLWHKRLSLFTNPARRDQAARASVTEWQRSDKISARQAGAVLRRSLLFFFYLLLDNLPFIGEFALRLLGNENYRRHLGQLIFKPAYRRKALEALRASTLLNWLEEDPSSGRIHLARARLLIHCAWLFWIERLALGWLPASAHRFVVDAEFRRQIFQGAVIHPFLLWTSREYRKHWLAQVIEMQASRGVLAGEQAEALQAQLDSPLIHGFVRDFGFTLALETLAKAVYLILAMYGLSTRNFFPLALAVLGPVPPSGLVRGVYALVQLIGSLPAGIRKGDHRLIAARLAAAVIAPWRWVGNLFAPVAMFSYHSRISLLLADHWVSALARKVPVFGGRGTLLEYGLFNLVYNLPISFGKTLARALTRRRAALTKPK